MFSVAITDKTRDNRTKNKKDIQYLGHIFKSCNKEKAEKKENTYSLRKIKIVLCVFN